MVLRRLLVVPTVLTALTASAALAAPASAEVEVHRDPRGDTQRVEERGVRTSADVLRLRGVHAGDSVDVQLDVVDLTGKPAYAGIRLLTPTGAQFTVEVSREGDGGKDVTIYRSDRDRFGSVDCPGLEGRFFDQQDRMSVSVPRSCINRPRWVRFGALAAAASRGFARVYADDARRDGGNSRTFRPVLGTQRLSHD